eukprot:6482529-Amphidinium_carterae.1
MDNGIVTTSGFYDPDCVKDYLRGAAEKYYRDVRENKDIAGHSMIRTLAVSYSSQRGTLQDHEGSRLY